MFREMRRKKQALSEEECIDILIKEPRGVLAVLGDNDYPYAVPLSHVYVDGKIYFHGTVKESHRRLSLCCTIKSCLCGWENIFPWNCKGKP